MMSKYFFFFVGVRKHVQLFKRKYFFWFYIHKYILTTMQTKIIAAIISSTRNDLFSLFFFLIIRIKFKVTEPSQKTHRSLKIVVVMMVVKVVVSHVNPYHLLRVPTNQYSWFPRNQEQEGRI